MKVYCEAFTVVSGMSRSIGFKIPPFHQPSIRLHKQGFETLGHWPMDWPVTNSNDGSRFLSPSSQSLDFQPRRSPAHFWYNNTPGMTYPEPGKVTLLFDITPYIAQREMYLSSTVVLRCLKAYRTKAEVRPDHRVCESSHISSQFCIYKVRTL